MNKIIIKCLRGALLLLFGLAPCPLFAVPVEEIDPLRAAIDDLAERHVEAYPRADEFRARLDALARQPEAPREAFVQLRREALLANPRVSAQPILFVVRAQYPADHHNTATLFQHGEINAQKYRGQGSLKLLRYEGAALTPRVSSLLEPGPGITPRDPEVSYDGKRIVFAMRKSREDGNHIYEINADGSGLKQLTHATGVSDIDPAYLPDGGVVFSSTREPKYCMCNRHIMANLFRMEGDGANIRQLGKSTLFEGHSALMPDGRILYDRWEYVDRNFGDAQGLWTVNPDGTGHALYWGNNTGSPGGVLDARPIPGTEQVVCIFSSCHDRPWGALTVIDRRKGLDGPEPVVRIWPESARELVDVNGHFDTFKKVRPRYEDPYPLSDKTFLVSRSIGKGEEMGIFLVDVFGHELLLHREAPGCYDPMPLDARPAPAAMPQRRNEAVKTGTFYVQDVYKGPYLDREALGDRRITHLRVIESPEKRNFSSQGWGGQGQHAPAMNWHNFENKRILGTVPVEADGSVCFEVPAERYLFFQLLDDEGMMVQSMRSGTIVQPGEVQGCVGCHENRNQTPVKQGAFLQALQQPPRKLSPWYGPTRMFSYQDEVQPVFDKHCVSCHDFGKDAGKKLILAGDRAGAFNASYTDLWGGGYIQCVGGGPAVVQQPGSWGARASRLVQVLREDDANHKDIKLSAEEMDRIVTWLDINAPYYPVYESAYPDNPCGRSPLTLAETQRLQQLTGAHFVVRHANGARVEISFDRPEKSPCLARLKPDASAYAEALSIIQKGQERLAQQPRADMPGFVPCVADQNRDRRYQDFARREAAYRQAQRAGRRNYDRVDGATAPTP